MSVKEKYYGITHGKPSFKLFLYVWRKIKCERQNIHIFDEVWSVGYEKGQNHYLCCDACNLMVEISWINEEYVKKKRK